MPDSVHAAAGSTKTMDGSPGETQAATDFTDVAARISQSDVPLRM